MSHIKAKLERLLQSCYSCVAYYGKLPKSWERQPLQNVAFLQMGQSPKGYEVSSEKSNESFEFHQGKADFGDFELLFSNKWTMQINKLVEAPAVVMSVRAPVGDVNFLTGRNIVIGRGLASIQPYISSQQFFYYLLSTKKNVLESKATGTTFKAINNKTLQELIVSLPPINEQNRIVSSIEKMNLQLHQFG
ncbi:MAG: restriction endonuclease subunit S [Streptococcaceae bacterium]|nr:restriction endonuclease subunit S [Streptococcaceae bacterium]MCH4176812.1 restriction endonuclease subunit S [Streptococcaceae bacterium]